MLRRKGLPLNDEIPVDELVRRLGDLTLPNELFRHRDHLRFAHHRLLNDGWPFALDAISEQIARFARHHGHAEKFHVTLTQCWVRLVAGALAREPRSCSFEELVSRHAELLDKSLLLRYYSRERLFSDAARRAWIEPDLHELPHCPIHRGVAA
jgi:hypothetical protein